ncbi:MAG: membrane integrity-associated transporter subunit PqiC [Proteobacteria bacterium]|nr:membrane integrity-associated transporter subunit PqiC [Pseudomonadota bacterium]
MSHRTWILLGAALGLAGCGGLFQTHETPHAVYVLRPPAPPPAGRAPLAATLVVARPRAAPGLDGERIVVRLPDRRLDAYAGAEWGAPVPALVEALLVDAFRGAGGWQAVVTEESAFPGRYLLQTEVADFAAAYGGAGGAPTVHVVIRGELGLVGERRLVASLEARGEALAAADRQREVAAAFEAATGQALAALVAAADAAALGADAHR